MRGFFRDLRYAARLLRKTPGFTSVAVISLALSIAFNTIVFSVANAVLLRPLPYPNADKLVVLHWQSRSGQSRGDISAAAFLML